MPKTEIPDVHPDVRTIAFLLGKWAGEGQGEYETTAQFAYGEETTYSHMGKAFLAYTQRSWSLDDGRPLHTEVGYLRCSSPGRVELAVAHPTGHAELSEGVVEAQSIRLTTTGILGASLAKEVSRITRRIVVCGDELTYELAMAAVGHPLSAHLRAELRRVGGH